MLCELVPLNFFFNPSGKIYTFSLAISTILTAYLLLSRKLLDGFLSKSIYIYIYIFGVFSDFVQNQYVGLRANSLLY